MDNHLMSNTHILHTKSFNMHVSIGLTTLAHMLNAYEIYLNKNKLSDFLYGRFHIMSIVIRVNSIMVKVQCN